MPDIQYANWLSMVLAGLKGMEMFSPASGEWKQAHSQARFVITQVIILYPVTMIIPFPVTR